MRGGWRALVAAAFAAALGACATPQTDRLVHDRGTLPAQARVDSVPFFPQDELHCGPAALAMAMAWSGASVTPAEVAPQVYTPGRSGSLPPDMIAGARRYGRLAVPLNSLADLFAEIDAGHPVVVFQNLGLGWLPQWHFAVATGYDLDAGKLILHSGLTPDYRTRLTTFERTWRRAEYWALVVMPPDKLPARGDELSVLRAAAGIERAARPRDAALAYAAMLERWPNSLGAAIGLGNARYASADLAGAEMAFRQAVARHPQAAAAWNNLAHVLAQRGQRGEALQAAQQAVRHGGTSASAYRATLEEISRQTN